LTVTVSNPNGGTDLNNSNNSQTLNFTVVNPTGVSLPFTEGFESATFPPTGWLNENPNNNTGSALWVRTTLAGGFGNSSASARIDQLSPSSSTVGQVDNLITPYLNLTTGGSNPQLTFSVANVRYNATYYDSLLVHISTNCGNTWIRLAGYGNNTGPSPLATAPDQTTAFVPTASQWATKTIDLTPYASQNAALIRFQLKSGWGQITYLDDINISAAPVPPTASFTPSSSSICAGNSITFTNTSTNATSYSWSFPGGTPSSSTTASPVVTFNTAGTYTVTLTASNNVGTSTATTTITVNALPNVSASASPSTSVCAGQSITLTGSGANSYTWSGGITNGTPFVPAASGTYTVTGTNTNGCTNTASISITVNPLPNVSASASPSTSVCAGQSITLTGSGANSYTWSGGVTNGTPFIPTASDTYTVTGVDANGCTNSASISITVNAAPNVSANASPSTSVCAGQAITLTGSGANTYTWSGGVTNGTPFVPAASGTYTVTGTNTNGCTNTATINITVNPLPNVSANASPSTSVCAGQSITLTGSGANSYTWSGGVTNGTPFLPTTSSTYTVTGVDANGCTNTASISITVNASPSVSASASPSTSVCSGQSITLTGSGANTYTWSGGVTNGTPFVPTTSSTYTVTGVDANGCTNSASISITVNANPDVTINASPSTEICIGESITLYGNGANSYVWSDNIQDGIAFVPAASATYTVIGYDNNGCSDTASIFINLINCTSGINEENPQTEICSIYPNPTSDELFIKLEHRNGNEIQQIYLLTLLGQHIESSAISINSNLWKLDIQHLSAGNYYVVIKTNENKTYINKVIKK
jgi:PKD repeat protein